MHSIVHLDSVLRNYIEKYPFLSDPIFLFNPNRIPTKDELLSKNLKDIRYPLVDQIQTRIDELEVRYQDIYNLFQSTIFPEETIRDEYLDRILQFQDIISLIRSFYTPDEREKYETITRYFGVDIVYCQEKVIPEKGAIFYEFTFLQDQNIAPDKAILNRLETTFVDANEIKKYFQIALKFLGIDQYWKIQVSESIMSIVHGDFTEHGGTIFIPATHSVSIQRLLLLVMHEIDGHSRQFTYFGKYGIYSPMIRSSGSEELLEGLAIFLEYSFSAYVFGKKPIERTWITFSEKFSLVTGIISFETYIKNYNGNQLFRTFRGFYNISKYMNTKDIVYQQGLYKILSLKKEYGMGIFDAIYSGVGNEEYVKKHIPKNPYYSSSIEMIEKSSAFYLLNTYFYDKK